MSFECDPCHTLATGHSIHQAHPFRIGESYGRCETCHEQGVCIDCRCEGDWTGAAKKRDAITRGERRDDLVALRDELLRD